MLKPAPPEALPEAPVLPPRVAFIIDDFGNSLESARPFLNVPFPVAISVLPRLPYSNTLASLAKKSGKTVLLHLPLEAVEKNELLGPGALLTSMDDHALKAALEADLDSVPGALGINNHMGSKGSADPRLARIVALTARTRKLFVIDSVTSAGSILFDQAREAGVPTDKREVFLDNNTKEEAIAKQVEELVRIARKKGKAIAIGHPHPQTLKVLEKMIPRLEKKGVRVVPLSQLFS